MKVIPGVYVHYKSDDMRYEVLGVGRNTETDEEYVIYKPLYDNPDSPDFWVRPLEMFVGTVTVGDTIVSRFRREDE